MPISLYDLSIGSYLQTLDATAALLDKALAHFQEKKIDPEVIVTTRLYPDMLPFRFQVQSVAFHAGATVAALKSGTLSPPKDRPNHDYAGLQALLADTAAALRAETRESIEAREGSDITFTTPASTRVFTATDFVLGFSLPNLHFHAATAYDILRQAGVPIGKRDFLGQLRVKETR
ncbi:DUF1993 domain-containing protein [Lichenihabitans sp. Uapishka_5]|uniref:DUF1993 domain-containing protein n=1 Tax=Lichenihabitans sp. Uapishka_5 TaxID=3037302 RepID=UPI0029E80107|nr:DUF1993 domain-containing protein [Lichenihabitans sp. Uapishka_5]MDX7952666.1 DUF1993 domain-containing protein [Lichenihabitans sp. Uapishka_5]